MTDEDYEVVNRIFKNFQRLTNFYSRPLFRDYTDKFVSNNYWVMLPLDQKISSLKEGINFPLPNIYIGLTDPIKDDGLGRINGPIGLTFHNQESMTFLRWILGHKESNLVKILKNLKNDWDIIYQYKINTNADNTIPHYELSWKTKPTELKNTSLSEKLKDTDRTIPQKGTIYQNTGTPIRWVIPIFTVVQYVDYDEYDESLVEISSITKNIMKL